MATTQEYDAVIAGLNAEADRLGGTPPSGPSEFVYNLPSGYVVRIDDTGIADVKLGGVTIAEGGNRLFNAGYFYGLNSQTFGSALISKSISGATNPVVTLRYSPGELVMRFTVQGNDIIIDTTVKNLTPNAIPITAIAGPRTLFDDFGARVTNLTWAPDHTSSQGPKLSYPSSNVPFSGLYVIAPTNGKPLNFATWPVQDLSDRAMVLWQGSFEGPGFHLVNFFFKPLEPGQSRDFKLVYRFSDSTDWKVLLSGYRDEIRAKGLPLKFIPDVRPVASFSSIDPSYIRPDNPYGYNDNGGSTTWRRLDLGGQGFVDMVLPGVLAGNYQGFIMWQPQGINPRGVMYRPDFNVFPATTIPHLSTLTSGFRNAGKSIGLLARPSVTITSDTWTADRLAATNLAKAGMDELNARFTWALNQGFNAWYLDSFAADPQDHEIMKSIRAHLGPNVQTFEEFGSAADMPYTGRFADLTYSGGEFHFHPWNDILRWLFPEVPWIAKAPIPPGGWAELFEWFLSHQVTPIVEDYLVSGQQMIDDLAPRVAQYVGPDNQWL